MSSFPSRISVETLRRFDRPGPRYTSYPTAVEFHQGVDETTYLGRLAAADAQGREAAARGEGAPLSLYTHLPFCDHRCTFCGCHVVITQKTEVLSGYLDHLEREIDLVAGHLPHRREVAQFHWGGGTPTSYRPEQLERLFRCFERHYRFLPDAEMAIEVDPRVTSFDHLDTLVGLGFNRLSLGVQDFTPEVQQVVERNQTLEETARLIEHARRIGFAEGINLDLIYGLPLQTVASFETNLDQVVDLRPDRVAVYSFAYVPWIKGHQKGIDPTQLPSPEVKLELYLAAMNRFLAAGYEPIGMDHFALHHDELAVAAREQTLHRNFMGYTVKPAADMLAFGVSGIGDVQGAFVQNNKKLSTYYQALARGGLPIERGYVLGRDDLIRREVITRLMCDFRVEKSTIEARFGIDFDTYFQGVEPELAEPAEAGLVEITPAAITVTPIGRLFVRNVCMVFDRYLADKQSAEKPVFSRTV